MEGSPRFGELAAVRLHDQRQMGIGGVREPERSLELHLPGCAVEQIGPPDDVGDRLGPIVDHDGELVSMVKVSAADHDIPQPVQRELTGALDSILEPDASGVVHAESRGRGATACGTAAAGAGICSLFAAGELAAGTAAFERQAEGGELRQGARVQIRPPALILDDAIPL
jgi:hypothetical protein